VALAPHVAILTTLVGAAHSAGVGSVMGDGKRIFSHPTLLPRPVRGAEYRVAAWSLRSKGSGKKC
jgi:hypothetical protein